MIDDDQTGQTDICIYAGNCIDYTDIEQLRQLFGADWESVLSLADAERVG